MGNKGLKKWVAAVLLWFWTLAAWAEYKLNLQTPQTQLGKDIYDLHTIITVICFIIFIGVFGFMFYAVFKHRKSVGHKAAQFHENTAVEVAWTLIPAVILIAMAVPATSTLIAMRDTTEPDLTIKATGYQWKWGYDYLKGEGEGISFYSVLSTPPAQIDGRDVAGRNANPHYLLETDNHVVVPVGKKVRILTTAADVIHAWAMPSFWVQMDAVPGRINETWFKVDRPGVYYGQCFQLCGTKHGFMPIAVEVVSKERFAEWITAKQKENGIAPVTGAAAPTTPVAALAAAPAA